MEELASRDCIRPSSDGYSKLSGEPTKVASSDGSRESVAIALTVCRVGFTQQGTFTVLGAEPAPGEERDELHLWPPHVTGCVADDDAAARLMTFRHFAPNLAVQLAGEGLPPASERFQKVGVIYSVADDGAKVISALATSRYHYDSEAEECAPLMHGHEDFTIVLLVGERD